METVNLEQAQVSYNQCLADCLFFLEADLLYQSCHEWKHWCTGGCPLATFKATGRYDIQSPNCNIYKALYPEALRLEGLRLIKYSCSLNHL